MGHRIFISYAREDRVSALRLYDRLKSAGADPWMDEKDLRGGQDWRAAIQRAIAESRYFIALISSRSVTKRGFVQKEFRQALEVLDEFPESAIFFIPVRLDESKPAFNRLKEIHWIDLFPDWERGISSLLFTLDMVPPPETGHSKDALHPRDKVFTPKAEWTQDGLGIIGGNLKIPPSEVKALFGRWLDHLPTFITQEAPKSRDRVIPSDQRRFRRPNRIGSYR